MHSKFIYLHTCIEMSPTTSYHISMVPYRLTQNIFFTQFNGLSYFIANLNKSAKANTSVGWGRIS